MDIQTANFIVTIASLVVTIIGSIYIPLYLHGVALRKLSPAAM